MKTDHTTKKLLVMLLVGALSYFASLLVFGLIAEREDRFSEAKTDIARSWGKKQTVIGPIFVVLPPDSPPTYILPDTLEYGGALTPEVRSRGIFSTAVYTTKLTGSGTFLYDDFFPHLSNGGWPPRVRIVLALADTRGIENNAELQFGNSKIPFESGSFLPYVDGVGLSAPVPLSELGEDVSFSFSIDLRGSEGISFSPLGRETVISLSSPWKTPKFTGVALPSERKIGEDGFSAQFRISSFSRSFPQAWSGDAYRFESIATASLGVDLYEHTDLYTQVSRSIKYAILFIAVTFLTFFLFETLVGIRIHPFQYLLVGAALALFYLLLLSFAEHIGFLFAYVLATGMTVVLISLYARRILIVRSRGILLFFLLTTLYAYLYFVLLLDDYALLFGTFLLFSLLSALMYLTRTVEWYAKDKS